MAGDEDRQQELASHREDEDATRRIPEANAHRVAGRGGGSLGGVTGGRTAGRRRRAFVALLAALTLAACTTNGSGQSSADGSSPTTSSSAPAPSTTAAPATSPPTSQPSGQPSTTATTRPPAGPISGTALDAAGRPYANQRVTLDEDRGIAADLFGTFAAALSLGASCVIGADPCRRSGAAATTTGPDGHFTFDAAAVGAARGNSSGVILRFGDPARAGSVAVRLTAMTTDLGSISLWNPSLTATPDADGPADTLRWNGPTGANGRTVLHATVTDGLPTGETPPGVLMAFSQEGASANTAIDRRAIEDRAAVITLLAGFSRPRGGQHPRIDWTSPPARLTGLGKPLSRGSSCIIQAPTATTGCPLTDGDLVTPTVSQDTVNKLNQRSCQGQFVCPALVLVTTATIDLGRPVEVGLIAVRDSTGNSSGNRTEPVVEVSTDGQQFEPTVAGRGAGTWPATLRSAGGRQVRYIRVTPGPRGQLNPSEVSAWPPQSPAITTPPTAAGDVPLAPSVGGGASHGSGHGRRGPLVLLALLLLALIGTAVAVAARRRGRGQPIA